MDEAKIDALFNLAGELIVAKNGIAHLAKRLEDEIRGRRTRTGWSGVTTMRSSGSPAKCMPRSCNCEWCQSHRFFVRFRGSCAICRSGSSKKVALVTRGETTEADKTIVDRLFEPLLHLVRNALDHGIESPEQRRTAGKSEAATVTMQASRAGDRLVVEVLDDGRGIDPEIVRRKARERGVARRR